jgi:hypothetical protein
MNLNGRMLNGIHKANSCRFTIVDKNPHFSANDGAHGRERWKI